MVFVWFKQNPLLNWNKIRRKLFEKFYIQNPFNVLCSNKKLLSSLTNYDGRISGYTEKTFYEISIIFYNTVSGNSRNYLKVFLFSRHFYCCWKVKEAVKCDLLCQFLHLNWQFCLGNFHWLYYEKFKYRSILFEFLQGY